jgi:predicted nucleic acid-binding protein
VKSTLIDAGPLIALFDKDDKYHHKVRELLSHTDTVLITTWPVITETCHMLDFNAEAQLDFLEWTYRGGLRIHELANTDLERIISLISKYRDRPMDLADASLVVTSEVLGITQIISIDRDFEIYRRADKKLIENILLK